MSIEYHYRRVAASMVVAIVMLLGSAVAAAATPALQAAPAAPAAVMLPAQPCPDPSAAMANWWKDFGWPQTGPNNREWRVESPAGGKSVWIWGGETYKNVSNPKLPAGTYNSYDTNFLSVASLPRLSGRLVREGPGNHVYYTPDHYRSWCDMGVW
jgi:hypothetical protein